MLRSAQDTTMTCLRDLEYLGSQTLPFLLECVSESQQVCWDATAAQCVSCCGM